jgi:hypothetical protein|tara:strand:- start:436 stop:627 length:192 start_codon:yes stop_codon:yes gene_type:complete
MRKYINLTPLPTKVKRIIMEETTDERELSSDSSIYGEQSRESLVDSDEISNEEAAFMQGYMEA